MPSNTDFLKIERPESLGELYTLRAFDTLLLSFCADVPMGSTIEVQARVRLVDGGFTAWFSWGVFSPYDERRSVNAQDEFAALDTDTLRIKNGRLADTVQLRILSKRNAQGERPALRRVVLAAKNASMEGEEPLSACEDVSVEAPAYSQMVRFPGIAHVICSATTIAMLLNQKGENVLPEEIALTCYDSAYQGCGNWSFSTAVAASYGYDAYVRFATLDDLVEELRRGNAVGVSVRYTNDPKDDTLPYVENAPCSTRGHLMVVCGFRTASNGRQFVLVHDPAAPENETVERLYPLEQFLDAWQGRVAYVVRREEQAAHCDYRPRRAPAELRPAQEESGLWALYAQGKRAALPDGEAFPGAIVACVTQERGERTADSAFAYGEISRGLIRLPDCAWQRAFVIANCGVTYEIQRC